MSEAEKPQRTFKGSGGTEGGVVMFFVGLLLTILGLYFFFDSVRVTTGPGFFSGRLGGMGGGRSWFSTTSKGVLFVPLLAAIAALFYDAQRRWAWWLLYIGIAILGVDILSGIQFYLNTKLTHLLLMMVCFAAGIGLMLRSYRGADGQT